MINSWYKISLGLLVCLSTSIVSAQVKESVCQKSTEIKSLEREVQELEALLASYESYGSPNGSCCESMEACSSCMTCPKKRKSSWIRPNPGITAEAEFLLLAFFNTGDEAGNASHESGSRYNLGYINKYGQGFNVRYFEFQTLDTIGDPDANVNVLQVETLDLEYASRFCWGNHLNGEVDLGVRWMSYITPSGSGTSQEKVDSMVGPLIGAKLNSMFTEHCGVYASARQTMLFGSEEASEPYDTIATTELGLGLQYQRPTRLGHLVIKTGYETQYLISVWEDEEDISLLGWTFGVGVTR